MSYTIKELSATTRDIRLEQYGPRSDTFRTFAQLKNELSRTGCPWHYGAGFHVLDDNDNVLFTGSDWRDAELEAEQDEFHAGVPITLRGLKAHRAERLAA